MEKRLSALQPLKDNPAVSGIFSDIDGTISPIAEHPDEARVADSAKKTIARLAPKYGLFCLVTGRDIDRATRMVGGKKLAYIGSHGLEIYLDQYYECLPEAESYLAVVPDVAGYLRARLERDGVVVERKRLAIGVHYRQAKNKPLARERILETIEPLLSRFRLRSMQAREAIELRPDVPANKGSAVRSLLERRSLAAVAYFGDDTTDIAGFEAMEHARQEGRFAAKIAVESAEAPEELLERADILLESVDQVLEVFSWLAE
ncbi:MAG: trehalose-phosphatase [Chloroflexi bacterium]|nr:trehalose-phosphatase [Chloroflexota bacterium]